MTSDSYHTLAGPAEAIYKEKSSKFLAYAYPVESEEEIRTLLDALRKKYYDATHPVTRGGWVRASRSSVSFCPTNWSTA